MATGRLPDPNSSPLTAKGDLYTYSTVPAKLAVGNNGETLVADSSASTGLRWQGNFAAGKNKIINGDFQIWQRGTSQTYSSAGGFGPDRWRTDSSGAGTVVISQQTFTPGTAPVSGYEGTFFCRLQRTVLSGITDLVQRIEDVRTFAGQTVTVSFWAKADTNRTLDVFMYQVFGSGGSGDAQSNTVSVNVTTSWARYTATVNVPSIAGKTIGTGSWAGLYLRGPNALCTLDYWGVQVEAGNVATAFQTATGTLAGELAACQRYYWRVYGDSANDMYIGFGSLSSTTNARIGISPKTTMRTKPTVIDVNDVRIYRDATTVTPSAVAISSGDGNNVTVNATIASGTSGVVAYIMLNNASGAYIGLGAEL